MASMAAWLVPVVLVLLILVLVFLAVQVIKEKEVMIVERFGKFHTILTPGISFIVPFMDSPRRHSWRYFVTDSMDRWRLVEKKNVKTVSTQNEVLDFPKQTVITRDNARISLDVVMQYCVTSPKTMIYSVKNLPDLLSKLLQAQMRNVAGVLDVDQIIEDTAQMDRISGLIDAVAVKFGVKVVMVKVQKIDAGSLSQVLAQKKQADLNNKEIIIQAKATKQTTVINAEAQRDRIIKETEGEAQQMLSRARGRAQAIRNAAEAEARTITEITRAVSKEGGDPVKYLLALKYISTLKKIMLAPGKTQIKLLPKETSFMQTVEQLGANTVLLQRKTPLG